MATLNDCNRQWSSRPDDERFVSLDDLRAHVQGQRERSKGLVLSTRSFQVAPVGNTTHDALAVVTERGFAAPTHWSFGQLASLAGAPAGYLRELPAEMAADCINYGLSKRDAEDVGMLVRHEESGNIVLAAATGPAYGRVWNSDIVDALRQRFGDGLEGDWRVPGEFGRRVIVTKANTTLYASDRDLWVFLANEDHRIELPGRRNGEPGTLARGFFVWNSETGAKTFGLKTFLFDYVCQNRMVWGAEGVQEFTIRHTQSAPAKFVELVQPALAAYAQSSTSGVLSAIEGARSHRLATGATLAARNETVEAFLARRFTRGQARAIMAAHLADEGRPVETRWDAAVGATAYARSIPHQDARVEVETRAGLLLAA